MLFVFYNQQTNGAASGADKDATFQEVGTVLSKEVLHIAQAWCEQRERIDRGANRLTTSF